MTEKKHRDTGSNQAIVKELYGKEARIYDVTREWYEKGYFAKREREVLSRILVERGEHCLSLACGTGRHHKYFVAKGLVCVGLDVSSDMLKVAKRKEENIMLVCGDAENLPLRDGFFDYVICSRAFKWFPNKLKALRESHRCLKEHGKLAVSEGVRDLLWVRLAILLGHLSKSQPGDTYVYKYKEFEEMFRKVGFNRVTKICLMCFLFYKYMPKLVLKIVNWIEDGMERGRWVLVVGEK